MVGSEYPGAAGGCGTATSGAGSARSNCAIQTQCSANSNKGIGDPSFLMVVPPSQYRKDYTISVPDGNITGQVDDYLTFVLPENAILDLNGENPEDPTSSIASEEVTITLTQYAVAYGHASCGIRYPCGLVQRGLRLDCLRLRLCFFLRLSRKQTSKRTNALPFPPGQRVSQLTFGIIKLV